MTASTRMSTKGQVIIPQEIRQRHGWQAGTRVAVEDRGDHLVLRLVRPAKRTPVDDLVGLLPRYAGPTKTVKQMDEDVMRGVREMWAREQRQQKRPRKRRR